MIKLILVLLFLSCLIATSVTGQSCQCSCDGTSSSPQTLSHNPVKRGKKGAKGERGEAGMKGEKGSDRKEEIEENEGRINQLESLVASQAALIDQLTKCAVPAIEHVKTNTSELLHHNEFVQLSCDKPYKSEGEPIRQCNYGEIQPNLQESPFKCFTTKYVLVEKRLTSTQSEAYCGQNFNGHLVMDGIDTIADRRKVCNKVGATAYVHIGFLRDDKNAWKRFDSGSMENFDFNWYPGYPKNLKYLQMSCGSSDNFGTVWDYKTNYEQYFICQYS